MKFLYKVLFNIIVMSATETACKKPSAEKVAEVFHHMQEVGCCEMCAHLYSGQTSDSFYEKVHKEHIQNGTEGKKLKTNPCVSCLGLLHSPFKENITDRIISEIKESENDYDSFNLALTLPISYQLRAHSLGYYVKKNYPHVAHTFNNVFPWVTIKDIFKVTAAPIIAKSVGRMLKFNSELTVNVKLTYSNDELECFKLLELCPDVFGMRHTKKFKGFLFSRKSVDGALNNKHNIKLRNFYSNSPSVPNHPLLCNEVNINQSQMYCAGRYNKYSRTLPQSPWIIKGRRRFNTSVQELFSKDVQALFKAQDYTFSSSGREDVDVRMLGNGRPFSIELINPKRTKVPQEEISALMEKLNKEHAANIKLNDMQVISKDDLKYLKAGEDSKTKIYEALCVSKKPLTDELLSNLTSCVPLVIEQKTPIRVLHRRANMVRNKTIHSMNITAVPHSSTNQTYFCLNLETQAGTYVKEFVNGDFGRTTPNLGSLLNDPHIDILALDVLNINLEWPPKKKYS
uniref:tRNA pseudouridine(55) synthase n=1 Tax=Cacopsylla melanoneura TaxID=428564 RepID=A0A8D8WQ67_9HEMI